MIGLVQKGELKNKYNINFDTLVLDCEGAFYYILMDMPEILENIKLIINEIDEINGLKDETVQDISNNFQVDNSLSDQTKKSNDNEFKILKKLSGDTKSIYSKTKSPEVKKLGDKIQDQIKNAET